MEHREFLGHRKYFGWYYNDGYMSLYIHTNPDNVEERISELEDRSVKLSNLKNREKILKKKK